MAKKQPPDLDERGRQRREATTARRAQAEAHKREAKAGADAEAKATRQRVAANVRRAREDQGLSQAELAYEMGYSHSAVYWMERDGRHSATSLEAVAGALGTTSAHLLDHHQ